MKLFEFFSVPSVEKHEEETAGNDNETRAEKEKLANEIFWYILDHDDIHKSHFFKIAREIQSQLKKNKKIDKSKFTECWMPMVEAGCLEYHKKHKMMGNPRKIFDKDFCKGLCERLAEKHIEDIRKGEYNLGD